MSENPSPQTSSDSPSTSHLGNLEGVSQLLTDDTTQQTTLALDGEPVDIWEAVETTDAGEAQTVQEGPVISSNAQPISRETELLALIHDLNECNDTLLSRIAHLEGELGSARAALLSANERAQVDQSKMLKQVSAEHASAQQVSQNAQQQIAKLVERLDITEQSLSRQQLVNENLQTELDNGQERIAQLERECTLMAQQHAEQTQARVTAESTARDLRSRLQRQQRYTLQFKAALEKSLTVNSARSNSARPMATASSATAEVVRPTSFNDAGSVAMPKAQRIMPWAGSNASAFQGIDPHLETLIRGVNKSNEPAPVAASIDAEVETPAASPEAEAKLWQDLERVINTESETATVSETEVAASDDAMPNAEPSQEKALLVEAPQPEKANPDEIDLTALSDDIPAATRVSNPKLNWQANSHSSAASEQSVQAQNLQEQQTEEQPEKKLPEPPAVSAAAAVEKSSLADTDEKDSSSTPTEESDESAKDRRDALALAEALAIAAKRRSDPAVAFTEPSPWGNPLPEKIAQAAAVAQARMDAASQDYLPAMEPASGISPVVKPLRSQKKIASLASVELPTFPKAKVGSFKR